MSNTGSMQTTTQPNGAAPTKVLLADGRDITLGGKGGRLALAWQHVWDRLDRTEWKSARDLAESAAEEYDLKRISVTEMLCRMATSGVLEQKMIPLPTTYHRGGKDIVMQRPRVHYRIADKS